MRIIEIIVEDAEREILEYMKKKSNGMDDKKKRSPKSHKKKSHKRLRSSSRERSSSRSRKKTRRHQYKQLRSRSKKRARSKSRHKSRSRSQRRSQSKSRVRRRSSAYEVKTPNQKGRRLNRHRSRSRSRSSHRSVSVSRRRSRSSHYRSYSRDKSLASSMGSPKAGTSRETSSRLRQKHEFQSSSRHQREGKHNRHRSRSRFPSHSTRSSRRSRSVSRHRLRSPNSKLFSYNRSLSPRNTLLKEILSTQRSSSPHLSKALPKRSQTNKNLSYNNTKAIPSNSKDGRINQEKVNAYQKLQRTPSTDRKSKSMSWSPTKNETSALRPKHSEEPISVNNHSQSHPLNNDQRRLSNQLSEANSQFNSRSSSKSHLSQPNPIKESSSRTSKSFPERPTINTDYNRPLVQSPIATIDLTNESNFQISDSCRQSSNEKNVSNVMNGKQTKKKKLPEAETIAKVSEMLKLKGINPADYPPAELKKIVTTLLKQLKNQNR